MITKQLFLKFLSRATFAAAAMLFSSSALFAQVKIGTNPTAIGANENLQIEAIDGSKTTSNKANGQFTVTTTADPAKFVGLQASTDNANRALVVNPADGVVKYATVSPTIALSTHSTGSQTYAASAFGSNSLTNPAQLTFAAGDISLNTGAATLSGNQFTITESGVYDLYAHANFFVNGSTWGGTVIFVNLNIERQASGSSTWETVSGSRTPYLETWAGAAISCQTSSVVDLNGGDKLRVSIFRGASSTLTGGTVSTAAAGNGVPFTKSFKMVKLK